MTIEERLDRVERKNRRLTLALVTLGMATALVVAMGMAAPDAVPDEIKAHSFVLIDAQGHTCASLAFSSGRPGLWVYDEKGHTLASLHVDGGRPMLTLHDEKGETRASLLLLEGRPSLNLFDEKNEIRATLDVGKGGPGLVLFNEKGKTQVSVGTREGGGGIVDVSNALGKRVVSIQANKKNCGSVMVSDQNGELKRGLAAE